MKEKEELESYWNYRVLVDKQKNGDLYFYIAEVYYEDDIPTMTTAAMNVDGESLKDLKSSMNCMKKALSKPILWGGDDFPKVYEAK